MSSAPTSTSCLPSRKLLAAAFLWAGAALATVNGVPYLMALASAAERDYAFAVQSSVMALFAFIVLQGVDDFGQITEIVIFDAATGTFYRNIYGTAFTTTFKKFVIERPKP